MAAVALRSEERIGLVVAVAAHVGLVALLLWRPHAAPVVTPPARIEVTISDQVGLKATSPEPNAQAAPDIAPEIGEPPPPEPMAAPPAPKVEPAPPPEPAKAATKPEPRSVTRPTMRPTPPAPVAKPTMRPAPQPSPAQAARPANRPPPLPGTSPSRSNQAAPAKPAGHEGGSRVGADFLKGVPGAQSNGPAHNPPAAAIGPAVQSALSGAITRQLKPRWVAPQGADAEKLVTILAWNLNRDGTLAGAPRVVGQEGITDANRPQAARHAEQAIRAVELAAPFELPDQYYDAWKRVAAFRFDKRLSQ
jgi:outer membrane biosynthesis protein TonB